jgi:hypothetical protein
MNGLSPQDVFEYQFPDTKNDGFQAWKESLLNLAYEHGVDINNIDAWREDYADGLSASKAFYNEFETLGRGDG